LFVHLLGPKKPDGSTVYAQFDGEPCALLWHTTEWRPGELLFDTYTLRVPKDLPPGPYALELGWYNESTGARLTLPGTAAASFTLANFQVK
jgi:hypothetical protein